jgi:RNase P/RNase MRP subunit POP5
MKLKTRPTERIKRRYLLIEGAVREEIEKALVDYLGVLGWAKASPVFVNNKILSVERDWLIHARAAFAVADGKIKIIKVSGTLAGLKR